MQITWERQTLRVELCVCAYTRTHAHALANTRARHRRTHTHKHTQMHTHARPHTPQASKHKLPPFLVLAQNTKAGDAPLYKIDQVKFQKRSDLLTFAAKHPGALTAAFIISAKVKLLKPAVAKTSEFSTPPSPSLSRQERAACRIYRTLPKRARCWSPWSTSTEKTWLGLWKCWRCG